MNKKADNKKLGNFLLIRMNEQHVQFISRIAKEFGCTKSLVVRSAIDYMIKNTTIDNEGDCTRNNKKREDE